MRSVYALFGARSRSRRELMKMNNRIVFITILCVCAVCMLLTSCTSGIKPEAAEGIEPSALIGTGTEPAETSFVTAGPTEAPAVTAEPTEQSAAFFDEWLSGIEVPVKQSVVFSGDTPADGAPHEFVYAYPESAGPRNDPVLVIPYAVAVEAENRLYDYLEELFVGMTQRSDEIFFECGGLCGEDWFVLESEQLNKTWQHLYTIWRRDDSGNWYEFGNNNAGEPVSIEGICFLSETTGFMCCSNYWYGDSFTSRLFATFDEGETWRDMGLTLPEEYDGYYGFSFSSPAFEGEIGVVFVSVCYDPHDPDVRRGCFITSDGGHSWQFREPDID